MTGGMSETWDESQQKLPVLIPSVHCLFSKDILDVVRMTPVFEPPSEVLGRHEEV